MIIFIAARTMGWALKASNPSYSLDPTAKLHAETYFNEQRSLVPPRRAEAPYMRKKLEDAKDPSDKAGKRYLLDYWKVPTEKQLQALFTRLETSRLSGWPQHILFIIIFSIQVRKQERARQLKS